MKQYRLSNGVRIPAIGIGTWQLSDRESIATVLSEGYRLGYRLIDTAAAYSNEIGIGSFLKKYPELRKEFFLSDKLWKTNRGYLETQEACKKSLKKLKTDYLDAYLIHWPASPEMYPEWKEMNAETWRGMEKLYQEGYVRSIGVCNFQKYHLEALDRMSKISPMINQFEVHPQLPREDWISACRRKNIHVEASRPLALGKALENSLLEQIAQAHDKSTAQICLKWAMEKEITVIPKTCHKERLRENIDLFDFNLTEEEIKEIDCLPICEPDRDEVIKFG